jgi:3-phosphoshikimate 1-carboxyvinyltransferase
LIINYLRTGKFLPVFDNDPNDIKIVHNAIKTIDSQKNDAKEVCVINVEDCGTAYRFLIPLLATTQGKWQLTGTPRLLQRPILPLVEFLNTNGASIKRIGEGWLIIGRRLFIENFDIDNDETSQYASALMMLNAVLRLLRLRSAQVRSATDGGERCFDFAQQPMTVRGNLSPYVKMTQTLLQFHNLEKYYYLADWSAAAYWIANALLTPNAHFLLKNLHYDGLQGDAEIVKWFEKWGVSFAENEKGIIIKHEETVKITKQTIDVKQTPDMAMILAVTAVCFPFELTMRGLKNLNLKESNRLDILVSELSKFTKIDAHSHDSITINKRVEELPNIFHFDSYNDHRFVMAWSLFKNYGTVNIINSDCVKKSYPNFC